MASPLSAANRYRSSLSLLLRVSLAAAIVAWLVREAGWREVAATLHGVDPWLLLAAASIMALESAAKAWNWGRLLDHLGCATIHRFGLLARAYLVGSLVGSVLPSTASTDAMRGLLAQRYFGGRPTAHAAAIIICNLLGWMAGCTIALGCVWGALMLVMLWEFPAVSPVLFWLSLVFPAYYAGLSLVLHFRRQ